ncbi:MAG: LiaF-related protein [Clostridia bacterium]|nr:LiaF-related protein [Clostridia bacterium]
MKTSERILWGMYFIGVAAIIVLSSMGLIHADFVSLILALVGAGFLVMSFVSRSFGALFFGLGIEWIAFQDRLHLPNTPVWVVLIAVVMLTIGFNLLFPKFHKPHNHSAANAAYANPAVAGEHQTASFCENDGYVDCRNRFGALAKYASTNDFKGAYIDNSFGELKVYFDNAVLNENAVSVDLSNSFGETTLFVPRAWNTKTDISVFAGDVKHVGEPDRNGAHEVLIRGKVNFGSIVIKYV